MLMRCGYRKWGIALQIVAYTANAFLWIISILAIICGFVTGFDNSTIRLDVDLLLDFAVTTPATAFIIYGLLLTIVSLWGCFATLSAKLILTIIYIILILLYFLFDIFQGFQFLIIDNSIQKFYKEVNSSLNGYGDENATSIGIIPLPPSVYWEHLQKRGQCCGLESFEDWRNTSYSRKDHGIPDSCCSPEYDHRFCGAEVFKHPDRDGHLINELLHPLGCLYIFPEALRLTQSTKITYIGRFACCLLLLCTVCTCVIIILVLTKKFEPDEGLDNLEFVDLENDPDRVGMEQGGDQIPLYSNEKEKVPPAPKLSYTDQLKKQRVHPENLERGDRHPPHQHKRSSYKNDARQKVLFRESGPQFIPRFEEYSESDNNEPPAPHSHHHDPKTDS